VSRRGKQRQHLREEAAEGGEMLPCGKRQLRESAELSQLPWNKHEGCRYVTQGRWPLSRQGTGLDQAVEEGQVQMCASEGPGEWAGTGKSGAGSHCRYGCHCLRQEDRIGHRQGEPGSSGGLLS
jgi:hypothetical protein